MDLKEKARRLPESPGVYIMKDKAENVIYIGKAKNLKNRVSQYFQSVKRHSPKILKMIELIRTFDYIHADTELEALLLECRLIKDLKPMFNSQLKNHGKYVYLWINTADRYPTAEIVQERPETGMSFGPYSSLGNVDRAINALKENFKLRHCKTLTYRKNGCLNSHLRHCSAPCAEEVSEADYMQHVKETVAFLEGRDTGLLKQLESRMAAAAESLAFDKAVKYRDDLRALKHLTNRSETIKFTRSSRNMLVLEKICDTQHKLFIIKGSRIVYKKRTGISQDRNAFIEELASLIMSYREELMKNDAAEIDKGEIDQAQIMYSYLKNEKECCTMRLPKSWMQAENRNRLLDGIDKLFTAVNGI